MTIMFSLKNISHFAMYGKNYICDRLSQAEKIKSMKFGYSITENNKFNLIKLQGQLIEKHQGDELLSWVEDMLIKESRNFILDLSELTFINEAGLEIIISILTRARTNGGECIISTVSSELKSSEIFKIISELFTLQPDLNSAQDLFVNQN